MGPSGGFYSFLYSFGIFSEFFTRRRALFRGYGQSWPRTVLRPCLESDRAARARQRSNRARPSAESTGARTSWARSPIYPLLAWELLTGCIESEAKSREIVDLCLPGDREYPDGVVMVRTNQGRDKRKTAYRTPYLAPQPQLAEIMEEYLRSPRAPKGRLLFPGASPDEPIGDWRNALDELALVAGFEPGEVRTIRFRPTFATHRAYTCDEGGQPMSALKRLAEMGHGSVKMLEERYFKAARFRRPRPHLEYRWSDCADTYRKRLAAGIAAWLSPTQARTLSALVERPMTSKEWAERLGMGPGTFFHVRARLVQMQLICRDGEGRGARWALSEDGWATSGALGAAAPQRRPLAA